MSYETLLASATNNWPCQELSGDLIDSVAGENLVPQGGNAYGLVGPRPWLPRAVRINFASQWDNNTYAGLTGALDYTIAVWIRRTEETLGFGRIFFIAPSNPNAGLAPGNTQFVVNDGSSAQINNLVFDQAWRLATWRRFDSGPNFRGGRDLTFATIPTTANSLGAGLLTVCGAGLRPEMAGLTAWDTSLSDADIATWFAGPISSEIDRRRRGSGKIRRPGRRR